MSDDRMRKILEGLGERKATSDSQERKAAEIRAKMEQKRIDTINAIDDQKRLASRLVEQMNERIEATGYLMRYEYLPQPDLDYAGVIVVTVAPIKSNRHPSTLNAKFRRSGGIDLVIKAINVTDSDDYDPGDLTESWWDDMLKRLLEAEIGRE